jgi:hypothetical protein
MLRSTFLLTLLLGVAGLLLAMSQPAMAQSSTQVVFSGTGTGTFNSTSTPFGFWIWCEGTSSNPYAGICNGAMYFYHLGITRPVSGTVKNNGDSLFTMTVHSPGKTPTVNCTLSNPKAPVSGPHNTVDVNCTAPSGGGTSTSSVVVVTGP